MDTAQSLNPDNLPGPPGIPILGNALSLKPTNIHQTLEDWALKYGPFYKLRIGPRTVYGVSDPETVKTLYKDRPEKFKRNVPMEEVFLEMGIEGVFPVEGEQWQRQRRVWIKAMNAHRVRPFFSKMQTVTERLKQRWETTAAEGKSIDVVDDLMRYTVDVTTLFAYGFDANTLQKGEDVVQKQLQHVFPAIQRRINSPFAYWRYLPMPADIKLKIALKNLEKFVMARIEETRARMEQNPKLKDEPENLLEGLLAASYDEEVGLTDQEIYGNTVGVMLAGEDTTAYTIAWMIYELIQHPDALSKLRGEVDEVLGSQSFWTELEQGEHMPWLDAVTNETQRLRPVAPLQGMTSLVDVELAGMQFPRGSHFFLPLRAMALSEDRYPDARAYKPERWIDIDQGHPAQQAPHPFGGGKRTCPGMNLALQEIKSVITMLVKNFDLELANDGKPVKEKFAFTMFPDNFRMRVQERA